MPRARFQTLTEQMFYVLLCLKEECYVLDILHIVPAMTDNRVSVGSGTLYNLLEQFLAEGMTVETKVEGRRRSYILLKRERKYWTRNISGFRRRPWTTTASSEKRKRNENEKVSCGISLLI